eukprot:COSAG05_NODE_1140_length_5740_cov_11.446020_2_plen_129_part_00
MGSYGEVWARRNVYSAPPRYYKCTATHGTPREAHGGPRGVVQQIPKGVYNTQGVSTLKASDLAKECDVAIGPMADDGNVMPPSRSTPRSACAATHPRSKRSSPPPPSPLHLDANQADRRRHGGATPPR